MPQTPAFPKSVIPIAAGLLLYSGAATLSATTARAEPPPQSGPMMAALAGAPHLPAVAPPTEGAGAPSPMMKRGDRCIDIPARAAARLAYLETRLELTTAQTPLFTRWKDVRMSAAKQMEARCDAFFKNGGFKNGGFKNGGPGRHTMGGKNLSPVDRLARTEERLQQRLADIRAERPALTALYASLDDKQKARFSHDGMHHTMMMRPMHSPAGGAMRPPSKGSPNGATPTPAP